LSSRSRTMIHCSFSVAFLSWSARPLALFANDYHKNNKVIGKTSVMYDQRTGNMSWATYRQRVVDGDNAGPQGLHVLVIFKPVPLPRGVIPINCASWQPWARR
jgi:hypothetical protein